MALGLGSGLKPQRAIAAEEVIVTYRQLEFSLSRESLEIFEETGKLEGDLRFYARFLDDQTLAAFRRILQQRFELDPVVVSQLTYSLMGEGVLQNLGQVIQTDARTNGFTALRAALTLAANEPEGFAVVNLIEQYPSRAIRIDGRQLLALRDEFLTLVDYRDAAVRAVQAEMDETTNQPPIDFSQLPDLSELGPYRTRDIRLELHRDRQTAEGQPIARSFRVNLHIPEGLDHPAPVVVISHGLGSTPEAFDYLGEHLASYGFATVLPQHIGSDESLRDALISGVLGTDINPVEFIDRPLDIRYILDVLEQMAQPGGSLEGRIDTNQVGVIGHSFGGYTALALAGAPLNIDRIQAQCNPPPFTLNAAPTLQCIATRLPNFAYPLQDNRVRAAIAISPTISVVLGPESMSQIEVPTLMIGGSNDFVASVVQEQIHPFLWMTNEDKYLALMIPSGHSSADNTELANAGPLAAALAGPDPQQGREYIRELSLAFMQRYLQNQAEYDSYLTPDYAQFIRAGELDLALVRSLTPEDLQTAYGANPPIPIVPPLVQEPLAANASSVLDVIAAEGVLRVAIRTNALPFGFTDDQGQLQGYCVDLMEGLAAHLTQQLEVPIRMEVVAQPTVSDGFQAVLNGAAMVECGPNSIRLASEGVTFSSPFFITGTHFLVRESDQTPINPYGALEGTRLGVKDETATERFLEQRYPAASAVDFQGPLAQEQGVRAMLQGQVDAFAGDGILLLGEAIAQDLPPNSYRLIPDAPLSCEPYGLVLPEGDRRWETTVNNFIASSDFRRRTERLFSPELYSYILLNLDFCAQ
ncbi:MULTISPECIES: alpha/beta fold hydrolase [unclassified Leptolyngbya]|uniref:alpha/beta fold hydrolase n=1 Tax=unclassified Leptolyngbya TaxID=2650499 RepID=UPI0016893141|nr:MULTISPECIES: alpha/beta fold hydrolase [unclassified Leptolyngbya]MBD1912972.1 alpha/beta fold hydrolase [Leptolyngbya sp. FACHB-8]MBD2155717.1 alpha/beta fold hydrolase [Leptolyngbya sp. FACHB-16]